MLRRDALSIIVAIGVSVLASTARSQPNHVQMPYLGQIDPSTGLLRSFDSGTQRVGIPPYFLEWFYAFNFDSTFGTQKLSGSIDTSTGFGGTIEVQDAGHQNLGPLTGSLSRPLQTGSYFIHVTAGSPVSFHFGVVAVPPLALYPNDAGHSRSSPLVLGTLTSTLAHSSSFYTYFPRAQVAHTNSSATGPLIPDFNNPVPYAPTPDWYQFSLTQPGTVRLAVSNIATPGETYVLVNPDGTSGIWGKNQPQFLAAGSYLLAVADKLTQVGAGGGSLSFIRNSRLENFEHYSFQLVLNPNVQPNPGGPGVDLTTTLLDVNTDLGIGGHSTTTVPGGTVVITYRVNNLGVPASSAGHIAYYISTTPTPTSASVFLVYGSLFDTVPALGSTPSEVPNVTLPSSLAPGVYYMIAVANFDHEVTESNYDNNASNALPITIVGAAR